MQGVGYYARHDMNPMGHGDRGDAGTEDTQGHIQHTPTRPYLLVSFLSLSLSHSSLLNLRTTLVFLLLDLQISISYLPLCVNKQVTCLFPSQPVWECVTRVFVSLFLFLSTLFV